MFGCKADPPLTKHDEAAGSSLAVGASPFTSSTTWLPSGPTSDPFLAAVEALADAERPAFAIAN